VKVGDYLFGPTIGGETASAVSVVWDLSGVIVSPTTSIIKIYLDHNRNARFRQRYDLIAGLFDKIMKAIEYLGLKKEVSQIIKETELEKSEHVDASEEVVKRVGLTPYSQETIKYLRDRWGIRQQGVDSSDFEDPAKGIAGIYYGIPPLHVKASRAIFDGKYRFERLEPNIRDHKLLNKIQIHREMGANPNFSIYVADVDVDEKRWRIFEDDAEYSTLGNMLRNVRNIGGYLAGMAGLEEKILGLGIGIKKIPRDVLKKVWKSAEKESPLRTNKWILLKEQFPNTCCVLTTEAQRDLRIVLEPMVPWQIVMYTSAFFTPATHYYARRKLDEIKKLAADILSSPAAVQMEEARMFAKTIEEVNREFRLALPVFESKIDSAASEIKALVQQEKLNEERFRASASELIEDYKKRLIEWHLDGKNLKLMDDIASRYKEKFEVIL